MHFLPLSAQSTIALVRSRFSIPRNAAAVVVVVVEDDIDFGSSELVTVCSLAGSNCL